MAAPVVAPVIAAREREWNIEPPVEIFLRGAAKKRTHRTPANREPDPYRGHTGPEQQTELEARERRPRGPRLIGQRRGRVLRHRELISARAPRRLRGRIRGVPGMRSAASPMPRFGGSARVRARMGTVAPATPGWWSRTTTAVAESPSRNAPTRVKTPGPAPPGPAPPAPEPRAHAPRVPARPEPAPRAPEPPGQTQRAAGTAAESPGVGLRAVDWPEARAPEPRRPRCR